jgi:Fe-Mn family superoxide dismutase
MMNRRDALRAFTITSAAALATRWLPAPARAADAAPAPIAPTPGAEPFVLAPLPYTANALEPHLDAATMEIHHGKHHAAYVKNLNKAVAPYPELAARPVEALITDLNALPADVRTAIRNNGGGHANHSLFWKCLSPQGGGAPAGTLAAAINATFGDFGRLQDTMTKAALATFGSGWAWLSLDADRKLSVESTPNQDSPLSQGRQPLFGIDVWEHAYYLRYQNRRAEYLEAIWNVFDWQFIGARYAELAE